MKCVLLYYKYVDIGDQRRQIADWFREACNRLHLKGRVRVALDGVNVTVWTTLRMLPSLFPYWVIMALWRHGMCGTVLPPLSFFPSYSCVSLRRNCTIAPLQF